MIRRGVPYGTRSAQTVVRYARGCAQLLIERGVKGVVIACNTVSAVAIDILRAEFDLPIIGVIEPGARAALSRDQRAAEIEPKTPKIGVLGTTGMGGFRRLSARRRSTFYAL